MSTTQNDLGGPSQKISLKERYHKVSSNDIWSDDALGREPIAQSLTNLVEHQTDSLVVSLHGNWGTGKTFLLQRWHASLTKNGFEAIYFNAWEDDFCSDPLVAIIGQISEELETNVDYKCEVKKVMRKARLLFKQIFNNAVEKYVGISFEELSNASKETSKNRALASYHEQRKCKDQLKESLGEMSKKVMCKTKKPLVFIIDELDRCRPTFAIELLERVKHIFDIPNMVFVLGVNHDELRKSTQSIYGEIDADAYFRRFFDLGFTLPEGDREKFCGHLIRQYQLDKIFEGKDYNDLLASFPILLKQLDLSLRDMDYCIRSIVFFGKKPRKGLFAMYLFSSLIFSILRLKNPTLYREFINGRRPVNEVLDYINEKVVNEITNYGYNLETQLLWAEVIFYEWASLIDPCADNAFTKLVDWQNGKELTSPGFSKKTQASGKSRIKELVRIANGWDQIRGNYSQRFYEFSRLLELSDTPT